MAETDKILNAINDQKSFLESKFKDIETKQDVLETSVKTASDKVSGIETRIHHLEKNIITPKGVSLPGVNEGKEKFSFLKAIYAIKTGNWNNAGFEKEVFENVEKRDLSQGTNTAGGFVVPTEYVAELIELLRSESVVMQLGATVLDNLTGAPVELPKQTGGATANFIDENAVITPSDQTFGQLLLNPKQCAALTKISNRLLKLSNPSVEAMVRRDIAQAIALRIDIAALRGDGVGSNPLGIANTPGIQTVVAGNPDGGPFTWAIAQEMEGALEDVNALRGKLGFAWHGKLKRKLKSEKVAQFAGQTDGADRVNLPILSDSKLKDIIGYNFGTSSQIPTNLTKGAGVSLSEAYFANWQELLIGQWGGLEIMASAEAGDSFSKNQTWIRMIQEVDAGLRHPESFCLVNDAETI